MNQTYDVVGFLNHTVRPSKKNRALFERHWGPATVVMSGVPKLRWFIVEVLTFGNVDLVHVPLLFGYAPCHPDDQFVRKIGVEVATKKSVIISFTVTSLWVTKDRTTVRLESDDWIVELEYKEDKGPKLLDCRKK